MLKKVYSSIFLELLLYSKIIKSSFVLRRQCHNFSMYIFDVVQIGITYFFQWINGSSANALDKINAFEFSLNVFSDKNICYYSKRARTCCFLC